MVREERQVLAHYYCVSVAMGFQLILAQSGADITSSYKLSQHRPKFFPPAFPTKIL